MMQEKKQNIWMWLVIIVIIAAALRFYGIDFGRPYTYHPDETKLVSQAGRLLETKFMDKDAYFGIRVYPPFYTYVLALMMAAYVAVGLLTGHFDSLTAVKAAYENDPFQFVLLSRSFVALFGVGMVVLIYLIGRRLYSKQIGVLAALMLATNFVLVRNSHFGTVDIPAAFMGLAAVYFAILVMQKGRSRDYILSALFVALATATKFSMLLFALPLAYAHFSRYAARQWGRALFDKKIWLAAGAGFVFFLMACPLIWLDFQETWGGIIGTSRFESVGKIGSGGGLLSYWTGDQSAGFGVFYPNSIPGVFGIVLTLFAALGLFYLFMRHRKSELLLLLCFVPLYLLFEKMSIKAMRHILPIIPFLLLAAVVFLVGLADKLKVKKMRLAVLLITMGYFIVTQSAMSLSYQKKLTRVDPRSDAALWINKHIPNDAAIAVESFPPFFSKENNRPSDKIYATEWTSRSTKRRAEFMQFVAENDGIYYIADDFTRQIFAWKYTKIKYPDITQDRLAFFTWLEKNAQRVAVFQSAAPKVQPTITIWRLVGKDAGHADMIPKVHE